MRVDENGNRLLERGDCIRVPWGDGMIEGKINGIHISGNYVVLTDLGVGDSSFTRAVYSTANAELLSISEVLAIRSRRKSDARRRVR